MAAVKIGLTIAEEADLVWVTGICNELGLRGLLFAEVTLALLLYGLEVTIEAKLPMCDLRTRPGKFLLGFLLYWPPAEAGGELLEDDSEDEIEAPNVGASTVLYGLEASTVVVSHIFAKNLIEFYHRMAIFCCYDFITWF